MQRIAPDSCGFIDCELLSNLVSPAPTFSHSRPQVPLASRLGTWIILRLGGYLKSWRIINSKLKLFLQKLWYILFTESTEEDDRSGAGERSWGVVVLVLCNYRAVLKAEPKQSPSCVQ